MIYGVFQMLDDFDVVVIGIECVVFDCVGV